jgi:hypothetical protein
MSFISRKLVKKIISEVFMKNLSEVLNESLCFQMNYGERMTLLYLLDKLPSKKVCVEIGTYYGGSLDLLSKRFDKVYSLDLTHEYVDKSKYTNVVWVTGDSVDTLPTLIDELNKNNEEVNFVLIDGNHEYEYVLADINNILKYELKNDLTILLHDSWYTPTRKAMIDSELSCNHYVHFVETDFCVGQLMMIGGKYQYMGGFGLVLMSPHQRNEPIFFLEILENKPSKLHE